MAPLMKFRTIISGRLLLDYFLTISMNKTLLGLFPDHPATWVLTECFHSRRSPGGIILKVFMQ